MLEGILPPHGPLDVQISAYVVALENLLDFQISLRSSSESRARTGEPLPQLGERFDWTKLSVTITPAGSTRMTRSGHTLTMLKKENGRWPVARDANLLGPPKQQ